MTQQNQELQHISTIGKFSLLFIPYLLISFTVSNWVAFTIASALVYWFILGPVYLAFALLLIIWSTKYRHTTPRSKYRTKTVERLRNHDLV